MALLGKSIDFLFNQMRSYQGSLAGGTIEFLSPGPGVTTPTPVYLDINLTQLAANPYMLSADGTAELFANGVYRIIVRNAQGVIVFDYDYVEIRPTPDTTGGGGGGTGGDIVHFVKSCLNGDLPSETLVETHLLQYWTRTGDSQYLMTINVPAGKLIYPAMSSVTLYSDGETMGFLYDGVQFFYPIVG